MLERRAAALFKIAPPTDDSFRHQDWPAEPPHERKWIEPKQRPGLQARGKTPSVPRLRPATQSLDAKVQTVEQKFCFEFKKLNAGSQQHDVFQILPRFSGFLIRDCTVKLPEEMSTRCSPYWEETVTTQINVRPESERCILGILVRPEVIAPHADPTSCDGSGSLR